MVAAAPIALLGPEPGEFSLRASAAPSAFLCPGSLRPASVRLSVEHDAAREGSAVHEVLRSLAETNALDWDSIPVIAGRHAVSLDTVRALSAMAAKLWPHLRESFDGATSEVDLAVEVAPGVLLTGHVDLLAIRGNVGRAADWKTGRKDADYSHQMRAYGTLVLLDNPWLEEVTVTIVWIRHSEIENYTMRRADVAPWVNALVERVVRWDGVYHPGDHCLHCPRSHECEAARARAREAVEVLADGGIAERIDQELGLMAPSQIVALLSKADVVAAYAKRVREAIKAHVGVAGEVSDGTTTLYVAEEPRRQLDPELAWPVLDAAGFGDKEFAACVDVSITAAEKIVAARAGRGKGSAAVRELKAKLAEAGAVTVEHQKFLRTKRA